MRQEDLAPSLERIQQQTPWHSTEGILEHIQARYPSMDYHGRKVFRFTTERQFGATKHAISFHTGPSGAVPEHIYQYVLLTYCWQGSFPMLLDGVPVTLHAGDLLVADRHCSHAVAELPDATIAVNVVLNDRFFEKRMLSDLSRLRAGFGKALATNGADHTQWRVYPATDELSQACIARMLCEHLDPGPGSADIIDDLCAALLLGLIRSNEKDVNSVEAMQKSSELIGRVHEYVARNYRDGRLQALADQLGYDDSYLSAHIKAQTGRTFKQLVNEERMRQAVMLLQGTQMPAYEVAQAVGISNLTQFYKRFRDFAGMTPQEYRDGLHRN